MKMILILINTTNTLSNPKLTVLFYRRFITDTPRVTIARLFDEFSHDGRYRNDKIVKIFVILHGRQT